MEWVIGIDGGGTKTVGWAADLSGQILGRAEKGIGNYHTAGLIHLKDVVAGIIEELSVSNHLEKADLQVVSLGMAGADRIKDQQIILGTLIPLKLPCQYLIHSDAKIALVAGLGQGEGIILIAGTGSIAYGVNRKGEVVRAGGWGHLASDEGSGYAIGRQVLVRGIRAAEGRDKPTVLTKGIMEKLGVDTWEDLIGHINSPGFSAAKVASLSQVAASAADRGDEVATEILAEAAQELCFLVDSVIDRGFDSNEPVKVCLYGGIINSIPLTRQLIKDYLANKAVIVSSSKPPVAGAIQLALDWIRERN